MESSGREHPLVLRVMRLTKPSIVSSFPILFEDHDLTSKPLGYCLEDLPSFGTGELLVLPQSFGNIFLGETFVSYLSVNNESGNDVETVSLKADLQTGSQRITLTNTAPVTVLQHNNSLDEVVSHEVKEVGPHILVCVVSYKRPDGDIKSFRKFFKFQVLKPLEVKTKFYNIKCDEVYLETQIQNIMQSPICMEKVNLDPSPLYTVKALNIVSDNQSVFGSQSYMKPSEVWQYLYWLKLKPENKMQAFTDAASAIGKLDIVWKSSLGERGRLQTSQLQRAVMNQRDIRLEVESAPNTHQINESFYLKCKITNYSERAKQLMVHYENQTDILWQGVSGYKLDPLRSKDSLQLNMSLIPISPGLQTISGLRIVDTELSRTYEYDDIHQILVLSC
ncbi:unnamed protein product [Clavelina lepadiformis]|uniref:Trafficking protein particle complex subunit 13 n=1 Tax=Clavelina lepadiformis TaxID=159417 RepID=A0ABP0F8C6_CLALP